MRVETFGKYLMRKRYEKGYTQAEMAKCLGISLTYYGQLERGKPFRRVHGAKFNQRVAEFTGATTEFVKALPRI